MNVSKRWLLDLVPGLDLDTDALIEHLALRGAPIESATSPGAELGDIVMGRVVTADRHPNADRLTLCTVDGGGGVVQVVRGAPNVKSGAWYPFAPVGARLPGDFKIKKSKIRGEVSMGMLCSSKELGLGVDHAGILEIEAPSLTLRVTASDASGNSATADAQPSGQCDDDDDGDDDDGDGDDDDDDDDGDDDD